MKQIKNLLSLVLFVFLALLNFTSCTHDPVIVSENDSICFDTEILPVLQISCAVSGCHDDGTAESGFVATDYESVYSLTSPGNPLQSNLYHVITDFKSDEMMPPDCPLNMQQRVLIRTWIEQGALNVKCIPDVVDSTNTFKNDSLLKITTIDSIVQTIDPVCFVQQVKPFLNMNCALAACHNQSDHMGGYNFTDYSSMINSIGAVKAGFPDSSSMYKIFLKRPDDIHSIENNQLAMIKKWILDGAKNNDCNVIPSCITDTVRFSVDIWPVINSTCVSCHNTSEPRFNINLDSYANIVSVAGENINGVSRLIGAVDRKAGFHAMPPPPRPKLNDCAIEKIAKWIDDGMPQN